MPGWARRSGRTGAARGAWPRPPSASARPRRHRDQVTSVMSKTAEELQPGHARRARVQGAQAQVASAGVERVRTRSDAVEDRWLGRGTASRSEILSCPAEVGRLFNPWQRGTRPPRPAAGRSIDGTYGASRLEPTWHQKAGNPFKRCAGEADRESGIRSSTRSADQSR